MHRVQPLTYLILIALLTGGVLAGMYMFGIGFGDRTGRQQTASVADANKPFEVEVEPIPAPAEELRDEASRPGWKTYVSTKYGFRVEYPSDLRVFLFDEGGTAESILFQRPGDKATGFQVLVSPYTGDDSLTPGGIRAIQPFTTIESPQTIKLAGVQAVLFWSVAPEIGKTREVWMARNGRLYAITAYAHLDEWFSQIMASWQFE